MSLQRLLLVLVFLAARAIVTATPLKLDYEGGPTRVPLPGGGNRVIVHKHVPSADYKVGAANWRVSLDPDPPVYTRAAGDAYLKILKDDFVEKDGWSYAQSDKELPDNSLIVHHYEAFAAGGDAGAIFEMVVANTPADLHWIMIVTSNHKPDEKHGTAEADVYGGGVSPYLDEKFPGNAGAGFFSYRSAREWQNPHELKSQLLLVTGPAVGKFGVTPGKITIYGAVEWGWKNFCTDAPKRDPRMGVAADVQAGCPACECSGNETPEPATAALLGLALIPLLIKVRRRHAAAAALVVLVSASVAPAGPIKTAYDGGPSNFTSVTWPNGGGKKKNLPNTISHAFKASEQYDIRVAGGTAKWETRLKPLVDIGDKKGPEYIAPKDAPFLDQLKKEFTAADGWSYTLADQPPAEGSLLVHDYIAHGTPKLVGAEFMVEYKPGGALPANIHWIQVVKNNHKKDGDHEDKEYKVDRGRAISPYYDEIGISGFNDLAAPTSFFFYDYPKRDDAAMVHNWTAELFLVTGPERTRYGITPGPITILGGIRWGWENSCIAPAPKLRLRDTSLDTGGEACAFTPDPPVPEPGTVAMAILGLLLLAAARCRTHSSARHSSS